MTTAIKYVSEGRHSQKLEPKQNYSFNFVFQIFNFVPNIFKKIIKCKVLKSIPILSPKALG